MDLNMIWIVIVTLIVALDRITKYIVVHNISENGSIAVIDRFFYLVYTRNKGAAWGIFQSGRFFFIPLTAIVAVALVYFIFKSDNKILKTSLAFILGGAVGNLIDRIYPGSVVDFLNFYIGSYNFPTFNVADTFVVVGTIILAYYMLFIYKDSEDKNNTGMEKT